MEGARDFLWNGLSRPRSVMDATDQYFEDQDVFGEWLDENCRVELDNSSLQEKSKRLYLSWAAFAKAHGEQHGTQTEFNGRMRERGFKGPFKMRFEDFANTKGFRGIALKVLPAQGGD